MKVDLPPIGDDIMAEVGSLCMAWAYLESETERALWGVADLDDRTGPMVTAKLDMRVRWQMIVEHAPKKHSSDISSLRKLNKLMVDVARDRNIIVHGLVHARADHGKFTFPPSWVLFRGEGKGKSYPVSLKAAKIVRENIQKIAEQIQRFNERHKYFSRSRPTGTIERNWPKPIP
jgi:hypothetical protein